MLSINSTGHIYFIISGKVTRQLIYSVFLLFFSTLLSGQPYTLKGRVTDKNSGEPLAFVNVKFGKGSIGTSTNIDGWFNITVPDEQVELSFTYIGYESAIYTVTLPHKGNFVMALTPTVYNLNEIAVMPGENPANRILNKAIANKDRNNPEKLPEFSYLSYNRLHFTLEYSKKTPVKTDTVKISPAQYERLKKSENKIKINDFLRKQHIFLMETITRRYFNGPGKNKEIIVASKTSGLQQPYIFLLANQFQSFSVYGEEFELGAKKYVSPLCSNCTAKYLFIIEDTLYNTSGDTIFIISFRPSHGKNFNGMKGVIHINSSHYAIENIQAEPNDKDTVMDVRIQQKYLLVEGKAWFPVELNTHLLLHTLSGIEIDTIAISETQGLKTKHSFIFAGSGKSYLDSINLKPGFDEVKFNHVEVSVDKKAILNDPDYFKPYRPDSLSEKDLNTYRFIDSIGKEVNLDNKIRIMTYALTGYIPYNFIDFDIYRFLSYNEFEGIRTGLGIRTNDKVLPWLSLGTYGAFGWKDDKFKYGCNIRLKQPAPEEAWIEYNYSYDCREPGKSELTPKKNLNNSEVFRMFLLNPLDFEESHRIEMHFRSFHNLTSNLFYSENKIYPHPAFHINYDTAASFINYNYQQTAATLRFLYREKFTETFFGRFSMGSDYPEILLHIGYFNPSYGNDFLKGEFKLTAKINLRFAGTLKATIKSGHISGNPPLFMLFNGNGSFAPFSVDAENTFQTMRPYEFFNTTYTSLFLRHSFGHLLFKAGNFKPGLQICHNMGIATKRTGYSQISPPAYSNGYLESGIVINNILKSSFTGLGIGLFYRYGHYSFRNTSDNFCIKISLNISQ